jgi:hypothetical protein
MKVLTENAVGFVVYGLLHDATVGRIYLRLDFVWDTEWKWLWYYFGTHCTSFD